MSTSSNTAPIAILLMLMISGHGNLCAAPATEPQVAAAGFSGPPNSSVSNSAKSEVRVSLRVGNNWSRVELNTDTPLFLEATGELEGNVQFELFLDGSVVANTPVAATRPRPMFANFASPDNHPPATARRVFFWTVKGAGKHELTLKVTTERNEVVSFGPVVVEAAQLQRPTLRFLERPPSHLLTTEPFNVVLAASTSEGTETRITLVRDELKELITTNGPILSVRGRKLRPGIYEFEAGAADDRGLFAKSISFTCNVDPVEQPGTFAPTNLVVETATLPGQPRPLAWRPKMVPGGHGRIAGAADALQLYWQLPTNGIQTAGTLIQRLDPGGAAAWKTVAIVQKDIGEWRDHGLGPAQYYKYRIAFMCDEESRTPFGPEEGESTCLWTRSYSVIEIPSGR